MARLASLARAITVTAAVTLALTGAATPRHAPVAYGPISIQAVFDGDGNPSLVANFVIPPAWTICQPSPAAACTTVRTQHAILESGPEPAGTVFTASATYRGHSYRASVTWHGQVQALTGPRVLGSPHFGARIRAAAGTWTGGWGNESDQLGLEACRTPDGTGCFMLSGDQYGCAGSSSATVVGGALTDLYLFALDLRAARDGLCAGVGYYFPAAIPLWPRQQIVARSAPVGPVIGPPAPTISILSRARVKDGRVLVTAVRCPRRCRAWLLVTGRRSSSWSSASFSGARVIGVPRRRLRPGSLVVTVHVDDGPLRSGRCRLAANG